LLLLGSATLARPSTERAFARQGEADTQLTAILRGGNVLSAVARIHYLDQERYAARVLARKTDTPDVDVRRNIAEALAQLTVPDAEPSLVQLTADEDGAVRMSAVRGLGRLHSHAVRALRPLLSDKTLGVRREAATALGAMHARSLGKVLLSAARGEDEPDARAAMLLAVGESGDVHQARGLERFLRSSSESTRLAAAQALCHLGQASGMAVAKGLLGSKEPLDRSHGIELFQGVPARISGSVLRPVLADRDPHVAALAARTLAQGGDRTMVAWLVLASDRAKGAARFPYEDALDQLQVTAEQRAAIRRRVAWKPVQSTQAGTK
jgi:HEAT repeat protein